jgi:isoleucyl-tRNA synthetase
MESSQQRSPIFFHQQQIRHRYPFCWRSDTPLIYKAVRTWFVAVEKIKKELISINQQIGWVPQHIKDGRSGKWLEGARDWAISRNRYWGTPIPIWRNEDGDLLVIGSVQELEGRTGEKITDLHRHYIDALTFVEGGKTFKRVPEVFDCWFESGSMPYAQNHFPFEAREETLRAFPADFIAEGIDQTRCWFYTLNVLSTALFNQPAFKNVIVNGIVLAEDGTKMSKRLKNYPEPQVVLDRFGADALRLYLLGSPAVQGEDLKFSERGVELTMRQLLIPLWNAYVFLATYATIYEWVPTLIRKADPKADIDRWILSLLQKLSLEVVQSMDSFVLKTAVEPLTIFIDQLTNWYIRRSRTRFWSEEASLDRREAFETLYTVLFMLAKIAAPFIPFLSEEIYRELRREEDPLSVHLCDFPLYQLSSRDELLEREMGEVQKIVSMGHALRKENRLKVRQPLLRAHVVTSDGDILDALRRKQQLIAEELNVKEVIYSSDEAAFVTLTAKPNFRILGKKVGKRMDAAQEVIKAFGQKELNLLMHGHPVEIRVEAETLLLTPEDVAVERRVRTDLIASTMDQVTVVLDTQLTPELVREGMARELINKINTMRRDEGYAVTDRISVTLQTTESVKSVFEAYHDYICHEVLALDVRFEPCTGTEWDLNGEPTIIALSK